MGKKIMTNEIKEQLLKEKETIKDEAFKMAVDVIFEQDYEKIADMVADKANELEDKKEGSGDRFIFRIVSWLEKISNTYNVCLK